MTIECNRQYSPIDPMLLVSQEVYLPGAEAVCKTFTFPYFSTGKEWQRKRSTQKSGKVNQVSLSCYPVCPFKYKLERRFQLASKIVAFMFPLVPRCQSFSWLSK